MAEDAKGDILPPVKLGDEPPQPEEAAPKPADQKTEDSGASDDGEEHAADTATEGESEGGEQPPAQPKKSQGVQKRLDELTRQRRDAERDRDHWRELAMRNSGAKPPADDAGKPGSKDTLKPPKEEDFEKFEDFVAAKARYEVREEMAVADQRRREAARAEALAHQAETAKARLQEAASRYEDFEEVALSPDVPISPAMANAMADSEKFGDIAYYLGSHPDEAKQIAQASQPRDDSEAEFVRVLAVAARAIGRIEDKFLNPAKPKTTSAPPPPKQVKGGDTPTKDPSKMTMPEYKKWRESGGGT